MLYYLSEDPWPLVILFGLFGLGFLIALWITRQGKYLVWAGITLGLIFLLIGIEQVWVTDNERIERVVYDLAEAVQASDAERVLSHLAPEADISINTEMAGRPAGPLSRALIAYSIGETLGRTRFDFVRISQLTVHAGSLSRQGRAEFLSQATGNYTTSFGETHFGTTGLNWSLGFRETRPGEWKVTRISPINTPAEFRRPLGIPSY
jgi:hypothetical protein